MNTTCEKCGKDIKTEINAAFDTYHIGKVTCPHCKKEQSRYISEADLLLYLLIVEVLYAIITVLVGYAFDEFNIILVVFAAIALLGGLFLQRRLLLFIYFKPPYKKAFANTVLNEDAGKIKKGLNIQFSIFIVLAFVSIVYAERRLDLIWLLLVDIIVSLLRYILAIRKEIYK